MSRRRRKTWGRGPRASRGIWQGYAALDAGLGAQTAAAYGDVAEGLRRYHSWLYLAVESMKNQYRRTVIGPWWLTFQTAVYVAGLAVLFGSIFGQPLDDFVPYVAGGFIVFTLLAGLTRAGAEIFVRSASTIKSTRQPLSMLVFQAVTVEILQFLHTSLIIVVLIIIGLIPLTPLLLLVIPAILLIVLNGVALALWLGPTVARFRDVGPFVTSILQIMIFFTPIFWKVDSIDPDNRSLFIAWNPFSYLLGIFRDPLLGGPLRATTYLGVGVLTAVNVLLALVVFSRSRSRLPYWVA